ncbi:hypothetical protein [Streptomyces sp. NPDC057939]|uniref:hypothetical protein n=1 Tax=Streptomyces sp. NPDC057939 TaxID=3346284 RepID=UPI0036E7787D
MDQSPEHRATDHAARAGGPDPFAEGGPFGGAIDPDAADGDLALTPPPSAAAALPRFSWQCGLDHDDPEHCAVDIPGSIDFPRRGDGTCPHGKLTYRIRRPA